MLCCILMLIQTQMNIEEFIIQGRFNVLASLSMSKRANRRLSRSEVCIVLFGFEFPTVTKLRQKLTYGNIRRWFEVKAR